MCTTLVWDSPTLATLMHMRCTILRCRTTLLKTSCPGQNTETNKVELTAALEAEKAVLADDEKSRATAVASQAAWAQRLAEHGPGKMPSRTRPRSTTISKTSWIKTTRLARRPRRKTAFGSGDSPRSVSFRPLRRCIRLHAGRRSSVVNQAAGVSRWTCGQVCCSCRYQLSAQRCSLWCRLR